MRKEDGEELGVVGGRGGGGGRREDCTAGNETRNAEGDIVRGQGRVDDAVEMERRGSVEIK